MSNPRVVYNEMVNAWNKANEASKRWNVLNDQITRREEIYCHNVGLDKLTLGDRLSDVKDKAKTLKDTFSAYSFWKGEVERHSAMLAGIAAFNQIEDRSASIE